MTAYPDAVQAALLALDSSEHGHQVELGDIDERDVTAAVAAQVRAEVAAEIQHRLDRFQGGIDDMSPTDWGARLGLLVALEIVEPTSARIADPTGGAS